MTDVNVTDWSPKDTQLWLEKEGFEASLIDKLCLEHQVDGKCLLSLSDGDFTLEPLVSLPLGRRKCLYIAVKMLQRDNHDSMIGMGMTELPNLAMYNVAPGHLSRPEYCECDSDRNSPPGNSIVGCEPQLYCRKRSQSLGLVELAISEDSQRLKLPPEIGKAAIAFCYAVAVTWITAFVMVIVHDRVPDMKKYPPLPDIFLDNVPHIPWAFDMCEITGTVMLTIWIIVLLFHKYRFILMRRFFALSGTVFLLRCVTMLITSLSVPGAHLQCEPRNYSSAEGASLLSELATKVSHAYVIWSGAGMSIQGVRTCGDYMFSGHTVALTMINFFVTEYTPRHLYFLHTVTWIMNMFGIFFILAAHEHYSIDVFIAFYITSRLFLYYHTLSNNQALMQRDVIRTRIWFPLFAFFESSVDGIVPNEFETPGEIVYNLWCLVKSKLHDIRRCHSLIQAASSQHHTVVEESTIAIDKKDK